MSELVRFNQSTLPTIVQETLTKRQGVAAAQLALTSQPGVLPPGGRWGGRGRGRREGTGSLAGAGVGEGEAAAGVGEESVLLRDGAGAIESDLRAIRASDSGVCPAPMGCENWKSGNP
ncbi:unnamed protein product [Linum trigynum]|uniref:Uncharacterized protein n=1 Tax=Linum trigynum TaxID=586398 RepID=A0AAV2CT28_9ROSI